MSAKKIKLSGVERGLHYDYLESLNGHNDSYDNPARRIEPQSEEQWVTMYRATQMRIRRERDAKSTTQA